MWCPTILVATRKDFETKNRKKFCGRIATGDYDAVIIGHSQFEKIPMSVERQRAILQHQKQHLPINAMRGKGVWTMQWSDKDISRIEGKFDSFCKTVLRNFARDWYRAKRRHHATEVLFSELPDGQLFEPIHNDPICPLEQYLFDDLELPVNINNDALAQALLQLSRRKRQIVLLAYFCDWTDQQISERFHVVRSTIQSARTKALKEMRELLEKQSET